MQKRIFYPPLTDEFRKYGDHFVKIGYNEATGIYCYKRTTSEGLVYFELFKAPTATDENGKRYERYPCSSEFGFGCALCIFGDLNAQEKIAYYMAHGFEAGRYTKQTPAILRE